MNKRIENSSDAQSAVSYIYMKKKLSHLSIILVGTASLITMFLFVNPEDKSLIYIFIPVIILWITLYNSVKLLLLVFMKQPSKLHTVFAFVGVSFLILLFLLSGIGQLSTRDIVLVVCLAVVSGFYFYRTWA